MTRRVSQTIGTVPCPISGDVAAVRKEKSGRLYFVSPAGKITPYTKLGQEWMVQNAIIWPASGPPPGTPDWITRGSASPSNQFEIPADPQADEVVPDFANPDPDTDPVVDEDPAPAPPTPVDDDDDEPVTAFGF